MTGERNGFKESIKVKGYGKSNFAEAIIGVLVVVIIVGVSGFILWKKRNRFRRTKNYLIKKSSLIVRYKKSGQGIFFIFLCYHF